MIASPKKGSKRLRSAFGYSLNFASRLWARTYTTLVRGAFGSFGRRSTLVPPFRFAGSVWISIGDDVYVGPGSWFAARPLEVPSGDREILQIGNGVGFAGMAVVQAVKGVVIEDRVLCARNVYVADHSHAFRDISVPICAQGVDKVAPVRICFGAWLGQNVVICPGVTVGRNAVVGANSVVRHDVPDFSVAAGAPANVIRRIAGTEPK